MTQDLVRKWMNAENLSAEQLAVKLGVSYPTVLKILSGKKVSTPTLRLLSYMMGESEADTKASARGRRQSAPSK